MIKIINTKNMIINVEIIDFYFYIKTNNYKFQNTICLNVD